MKRIALLVLSMIIFASLFAGCKDHTPQDVLLLQILDNESAFINESGRTLFLRDYKLGSDKSISTVPQKRTLIDLDGDGANELIVHLTSDDEAYIVFHVYKNKIYCFEFSKDNMQNLKKDGSFLQGGDNGISSYVTLVFDKTKYTLQEEAYINETDQIYRVGGAEATADNAELYAQSFENKEDASWVDINKESDAEDGPGEVFQGSLADKYKVDSNGNVLNYISTINVTYKLGDHFEIYTDEARTVFYYIVRNNDRRLLDVGYHDSRGVDFYYKNGLLVLDYSFGRNIYGGDYRLWSERYYNTADGSVSRLFPNPVASSDQLVAYFDTRESDGQYILVVQDIFDPTVYYEVIQRDFTYGVFQEQAQADFFENSTKLKITYPVKGQTEKVTEEIELNIPA